MKTTNNTVLITGGSAGIGLEIAKAFSEQGNHVIITGRDEERLRHAAAQLKNATSIVHDVTSEQDTDALIGRIEKDFPHLNILVNNAGKAYAYQLNKMAQSAAKARQEMETNLHAVIDLTEKLLPVLLRQQEAAIINVSSIVAFVPAHGIATYSASKAALHSYTQSLRYVLNQSSSVKVFELMPPLVNTEFSKDIGGASGIPPAQVAMELLRALRNDTYEIRVGTTEDIYQLYRSDPDGAFQAINGALA